MAIEKERYYIKAYHDAIVNAISILKRAQQKKNETSLQGKKAHTQTPLSYKHDPIEKNVCTNSSNNGATQYEKKTRTRSTISKY